MDTLTQHKMDVRLDNYDDILTTDSDDSSVDEGDVISDLGMSITQCKVGSRVIYDVITRGNLGLELPWDYFMTAVNYMLKLRQKTFRNLVLSVVSDSNMYRRISLTKKRLQNIDKDIVKAFDIVSNLIQEGRYEEIYDDYDSNRVKSANGASLDDFRVLTSIFEVVYDVDQSGGCVTARLETRYIRIEEARRVYGPLDCFFDCVHQLLGLQQGFNVEALRKKIRAWPSREISIKHIKRFEKYTNVKVTVYGDDSCDNNTNIIYQSAYMSTNHVKIALFNNHYYIYRGQLNNKDMTVVTDFSGNSKCYVFYDFETYMHPKLFNAIPYAMSYCVVKNGIIAYKGAFVTDGDEDELYTRIYWFFHELMDKRKVLLVGFNNSAFDDYLLIDILATRSRRLTDTLINRQSRILRFTHDCLVSKDLYMFLTTSLSNALKSFNCSQSKRILNHVDIQTSVYEGNQQEWIDKNREEIIQYAIQDVACLCELYFKVRETFMNINRDMDVDDYITMSQMSMKAFSRSLKYYDTERCNAKRKLVILPREIDKLVRKALVAGRCQVFDRKEQCLKPVQSVDVVSLYPYVMMNRKYPFITCKKSGINKRWEELDKDYIHYITSFDNDLIGFYNVVIKSQPCDAIVPYRNDDGTLNWDPETPFSTWSDSVTLSCLLRYGGTFDVVEGYVLTCERDYIFRGYLEPLMRLKREQDMYNREDSCKYNPCLRECLKLLMNSLSGKMIEKPIDRDRKVLNSPDAIDNFIKKYKDASVVSVVRDRLWLMEGLIEQNDVVIKSPSIEAMLIYAYAREYMYDNLISKVKHKYSMDTDSLHFDSSDITSIESHMFGDACGQLKTELPHKCYGIYPAKKVYANYTRDANGSECVIKAKFKGISKRDKLIPIDMFNTVKLLIYNRDHSSLHKIWISLPIIDDLKLIRSVLQYERVYLLSNTIAKTMRSAPDTNISIFNYFFIKSFPKDYEANNVF